MSALPKQDPRVSMLACPACGRLTAQDFLYAKNGCDILRCTECGIGRTETTNFDPAAYYTEDYFSGQHDDGYADYRGAEPVLRKEFARVVEFVREHKTGGRLLDVGCAYGFFLQEAKSHFEVAGIEIAQEAAAHARANGLNVIDGVADGPTMAKLGSFDVIVMLDVIEHLPDPRETLALLERHLNPDGIIVVTTGDFGSQYARLSGSGWRLMTPPQHLWFFTRESMSRLADRLGMTLVSFTHPWKVVPVSLIAYQLKRMLGLKPSAQSGGSNVGLPVNLFDAMRVVMRKPS